MMNCSPYNVNDTIRKNPSKPNRVGKKERKRRQLDRGDSDPEEVTSLVHDGHDHAVPTALIKLHEQPLRDQLIESMRMENKSCSGTRDKEAQKRTYNLSQMSTQKGIQHKQQSMRYDQQPKAKAIIAKKSDTRKESGSQVVKKLLAGGLLQNAKPILETTVRFKGQVTKRQIKSSHSQSRQPKQKNRNKKISQLHQYIASEHNQTGELTAVEPVAENDHSNLEETMAPPVSFIQL